MSDIRARPSTAEGQPEATKFVVTMAAAPGHVPSLDGLRGISVLLVILSHFVSASLFPGGLGVLVFFVISGFLITRLVMLNRADLKLLKFWQRRIWRLYPAVAVYCVTVILWEATRHREISFIEPIAAITYWANYLYAFWSVHNSLSHMPLEHFWSLSVEEHFYILFPFLILAVDRHPKRILVAMTALSATCLFLRIGATALWPFVIKTRAIYYTELRMDSIAFGVMVAALCEFPRGRLFLLRITRPDMVAIACFGLAISLLYRDPWFRETFRYSVEAASMAVILSAILFSYQYRLVKTLLNWQPLVWVGILSYSLYVWHPLVAIAFSAERQAMPYPLWLGLALSATFFVAAFSFYVVETPMRSRFSGRSRE